MTTENSTKSYKPIRIREVFAAKNPGLAKFIPGFVYRYLNNILHLDEVNTFLEKHGHLEGIDFVENVVEEFNVQEYVHNIENIPETGRYIFVSNHPLGGFDGMLLMKNVEARLGSFKFLSNDILLNIPQLAKVFVPVNKHGGHERKAAKMLSECYNSEDQILIFPSGLASRKIKGKIVDLEWKKHFISKAVKHQRDIVPVFISGRNSNRFYRIAKLRKFLRIKWNLEMFFLPDETIKHKNTKVHLYFGKPIPYTTFDNTKTYREWAEWVKDKVYKLKESSGSAN
ncbi:1-acyl-sn-glycerol-3-phosphate acyltransferase [Draconibacterium halophilum]|uniref:Glycerol acyltransferase n=1 Tax=Draconibacterium halophilum TaxID=2706887 RepID=A0A6C0RFN2_9BACT|nr:1-acyl-sn-glycerol-3-phosphate acyltransferase [Draconibacterium halophilum]QIA09518.1 glycerol acyltransferase [Draconibacterium halophilum]